MLFLSISNSLLIICGVNQRQVSKSMFANLRASTTDVLKHQNCLATSDRATLGFYFSLAVFGAIGDKLIFGFANLIC